MKLGFAMCGSFCTHAKALTEMSELAKVHDIIPIVSENVYSTDTYFGKAEDLRRAVFDITGREVIHTITGAEPFGPKEPLDALIICPCTGNTLSKMAMGVTDTAVTMSAKAHLRCDRPLIIALASNDALSANLKNIGTLLQKKSVYFVPMRQDDPEKKPHSLVADFTLLSQTLDGALTGIQIRPIFI